MDTIVALSTPPGRGALGVIRLSGADSPRIAAALAARTGPFPIRHATLATIDTDGSRESGMGDFALGVERTSAPALPDQPPCVSTGCPDLRQESRDGRLPTPVPRRVSLRDEAVVTVFAAPRSYTGEDMAEISCHGSPIVLEAVLLAAVRLGARLAERGEFTLRAFLHGRLDLAQAEAVADLVNAVTPRQARSAFAQLDGSVTAAIGEIDRRLFELAARLEASLDFPDEGYHFVDTGAAAAELSGIATAIDGLLAQGARGRLLREGAVVAIAGRPNVGKSSLFNTLLQANRAIVAATPGTTRDLLTERADVEGIPVRLVDTAGLREASDEVEREGVTRARGALAAADLTVVVLDRSRPLAADDRRVFDETQPHRRLVLVNKIDLPSEWTDGALPDEVRADAVHVSLKTGEGVPALAPRLAAALAGAPDGDTPALVTNVRHLTLLEQARTSVGRAINAIDESNESISEEFLLVDLQDARAALEAITGRRSTDDLLRHIFENFCIGK
jgi:tRNA modification GTPase